MSGRSPWFGVAESLRLLEAVQELESLLLKVGVEYCEAYLRYPRREIPQLCSEKNIDEVSEVEFTRTEKNQLWEI
eukprot:scaffold8102_cov73-Cyclotella_meneghiniana.AAC.4